MVYLDHFILKSANLGDRVQTALGVLFDKYVISNSIILAGVDREGTVDLWYVTKNEQENTQNNVIVGDIRRDMTVYTDQRYQEKDEAAANTIFQMKQIDHLNKGHDDMDVPAVEEVLHVYSYPLLEYMGFNTDISDGVKKMRAATVLSLGLHHKCLLFTIVRDHKQFIYLV